MDEFEWNDSYSLRCFLVEAGLKEDLVNHLIVGEEQANVAAFLSIITLLRQMPTICMPRKKVWKLSREEVRSSFLGRVVSASDIQRHCDDRQALIEAKELPPEKPSIKAEKGWYASGDSLRAQCSSPPADPPANLTWMLNGRGIQGKPVIQQRILPSPVVSIEVPHGPPHGSSGRSTPFPGDENSNIIFSPWKAFGPFVDTIQEGDFAPSQDTVMLPTPRHHDSMDEDATDPMPTAETSNKVASISQLSFMVRPDSFERGQLRLTCISSVHAVYSEQAELVINEERPQIASVLGTRDQAGAVAASALLTLVCLCSTITIQQILRQIVR